MKTPTENLQAIDDMLSLNEISGANEVEQALTELRSQVADLLAFYRYNTTWTMSNYEAYCALCDRLAGIQESPVDEEKQS